MFASAILLYFTFYNRKGDYALTGHKPTLSEALWGLATKLLITTDHTHNPAKQ